MAVKIRLARGGAKKKPYYRIVVANATAPRDGDFLEKVGTYNPLLPKGEGDRVTLKAERITYWLSQGATPTDTVAKFIAASGIELPDFVASKMALKLKARKSKVSKNEALEEASTTLVTPPAPTPAPVAEKVEEAAPVVTPAVEVLAAETAQVVEEASAKEEGSSEKGSDV